MARFNQTDFESGPKKEVARKRIVKAAKRRGIKVANGDIIAKRRKPAARKTASRKKTGSSRKKTKR